MAFSTEVSLTPMKSSRPKCCLAYLIHIGAIALLGVAIRVLRLGQMGIVEAVSIFQTRTPSLLLGSRLQKEFGGATHLGDDMQVQLPHHTTGAMIAEMTVEDKVA